MKNEAHHVALCSRGGTRLKSRGDEVQAVQFEVEALR